MFRPIMTLVLFAGFTLVAAEVFAQSPVEDWTDDIELGEGEFQSGPLLGAWGRAGLSNSADEPEPIATDRPDFTESSTTVGAGVSQIEAGYTYTRDSDEKLRGHSWGEPLLRVGVGADWFELRAALSPTTEIIDGDRQSGLEDLYLGVKLGLTSQAGWLPEVALVPQMTVPTGSSQFTADQTLPGCNLLYGWDISEVFSTAGSTQVNRAVDGDDKYVEWAQSWTVGYALADDLGLYTEWFAILPEQSSAVASEHYLNGGVTWRLNDDTQFDVRVGTGLNDDAADFFCGAGLSVRFR